MRPRKNKERKLEERNGVMHSLFLIGSLKRAFLRGIAISLRVNDNVMDNESGKPELPLGKEAYYNMAKIAMETGVTEGGQTTNPKSQSNSVTELIGSRTKMMSKENCHLYINLLKKIEWKHIMKYYKS
jgi:hypothetical protein